MVDEAGPDSNRNFYGTMFFRAESVLYHESSLAAATFICLGMSQTAYSIPMNALQPKLTTDRTERVKLGTYGGVASSILNAIVPAVTMPLVRCFPPQIRQLRLPNWSDLRMRIPLDELFGILGAEDMRSTIMIKKKEKMHLLRL